jgi:hypothetical protein
VSARLTRGLLRSIGIAIAIAAAIDPVFSIERHRPSAIAVADLTAAGADGVLEALRDRGGATVIERRSFAGRIPCAPHQRCVIVSDGTVMAELPEDVTSPVLIVANEPGAPNVRLISATVTATHVAAASSLRVALAGQGVAGRETTVRIRDGEAIVGSARHQWTAEGTVTVDVPWWPMAPGPRLLRVEGVAAGPETSAADNAIDVAVSIASDRLPVLVFDTRPSWSSTFVRRALEDDPRFAVEHRARVAPALTTSTAGGRLDARTLDLAAVLIVGAPDGLTEAEAALVDRFVRQRGGTAILLPERQPAGAASRLFRGTWTEQLVAEPQAVGPLRATEILRTADVPLGSTVIGTAGDRAALVHVPSGEGAVLVSGAMDAWRFREHDQGAFDRFWRSIAAQAAADSAALRITFADQPALAGTRQRFQVRRRAMDAHATTEASAVARCPPSVDAVRLWPAGPPQTFTGEITAAASRCELEVSVGELRASGGIAVADAIAPAPSRLLSALEHDVVRAGGTIAGADDVAAADLDAPPAAVTRVAVHPMRSPWWIVPFALCLSGEWWLRRRHGLR